MEYKIDKQTLFLYFIDKIDSLNAPIIESEINEIINNNKFEKIILDFKKLNFISSAGLRIVLKLKQKYQEVSIIEASLDVYDILSMTGFTEIMNIKKALKEISVENAKIIGEGFFSTVYRLDKEMIVKVFNRVSDPFQIERELKLAKEAFILKIPTAISYDIVRVNDKLGVRFEMLDCMSLKNCLVNYPDKYDHYVDKYVSLLKTINSTKCSSDDIPSIKAFYLNKIEKIKDFIEDKYYLKAKKLIENIKDSDTFVHGDCHFKNIFVHNDELLLIDMDTLSKGNFIFELAAIYAPYVAFEQDNPGNSMTFFGVSNDFVVKLFDDVVNRYLSNPSKEAKDKIALVCYIHMLWWTKTNQEDNYKRFDGCKERLYRLLDKYDDLDIE